MNRCKLTALVMTFAAGTLSAGCATYGDFELASLDGQTVSLGDQQGKAVLLAFWAVG
ncbi:MAG: redoxin domain-containing protein [Planctomycetes bacterium]|nr:redoxin domain-containing protein [Planctomycetota bacterium]